jgi:predicted GNAT family acetyltransferase
LAATRALLDTEPVLNVFVRHRVEETGLEQRLLGGAMWGWFTGGSLTAALHAGANVVPVNVEEASATAFAARMLGEGLRPSSVVGPKDQVELLWRHVEQAFGPARSPRWNQPFMAIDRDPLIASDVRVRRVVIDEVDTIFGACVAMFTEEVGVAPSSERAYRARLTQLVAAGWSFAIIDRGQVLFKAEVAAAAAGVCQVQGVWVSPALRGTGMSAPAMAAVVRMVRESVAPVVTLYVNDHNIAARRAYTRVGFEQHATFASVLL